ncbi:hypothetical protein ASPCADRAFT_128303 [Aspergillus carbonarius ITEM 5010]|uniref:Aminotransferase class I/classII large domain-containing protein n=1 Tax=Aspergillus carbonarius (strain ITEM 5010) TaxID=602072 RepID=A0A1R3RUI2_ASPC5|nr:hypothetical protein ASPCADRAFT_128303 [Aspergillus carbonarius ITEM 5010]
MANMALLATWFPDHKAKGPSMRTAPTFFRNLEEALDLRRAERSVFLVGAIRTEFLNELARNPGFELGAGGSRLLNGNNAYTEAAEAEIAEFHGGESALLFHSGFEANTAIMAAIPRPGDAIVYDELIHASMHEGMQASKAPCKKSFKHNDVDSFRETLLEVLETQSLIKQGKRCVLICLESMYSRDGDVAPLRELIAVAKELFPEGNAQFLVDEAHTTGVLGRQGRGFVNELGLEDEVAIRMHTYGKALATTGAVVVSNQTIREVLINHARCFIYSTAPSFPMVAAIRAGYKLLMTGQTQALQDSLQRLVKHFFETITANPVYDEANDAGILSTPPRRRLGVSPVSHAGHTRDDASTLAGLSVFPIDYPVVPKGKGRVRVVLHAGNTTNEVEKLAATICEWAQEMLDIEESGKGGAKIPSAARQV